jgi:7-carboxy-7-deazaguanine synthase
MFYSVKEIYYTLHGEGANVGRASVFCRFAGCNLWTGREEHRADAVCQFCDTDFVGMDGPGGGRYRTPEELVEEVASRWPTTDRKNAWVVCTGGEPLLQLDDRLVQAFHDVGFRVAIETNGTLPSPRDIDWICVSPKAGTETVLLSGDELKLVYPKEGAEPERYQDMDFRQFFLQPMDGPDLQRNIALAVEYCMAHPKWRLSLQTNKLVGLP